MAAMPATDAACAVRTAGGNGAGQGHRTKETRANAISAAASRGLVGRYVTSPIRNPSMMTAITRVGIRWLVTAPGCSNEVNAEDAAAARAIVQIEIKRRGSPWRMPLRIQ